MKTKFILKILLLLFTISLLPILRPEPLTRKQIFEKSAEATKAIKDLKGAEYKEAYDALAKAGATADLKSLTESAKKQIISSSSDPKTVSFYQAVAETIKNNPAEVTAFTDDIKKTAFYLNNLNDDQIKALTPEDLKKIPATELRKTNSNKLKLLKKTQLRIDWNPEQLAELGFEKVLDKILSSGVAARIKKSAVQPCDDATVKRIQEIRAAILANH